MFQRQSLSATASVGDDNASLASQEEVNATSVGTSRSRYRTLLLLLFGTEGILFLWLLPQDKVTLYRLRSALPLRSSPAVGSPQNPYLSAMKNDPKLGTLLLPTGIGTVVRRVAPKKVRYTLLGYVGNCASCLNVNLKAWQAEAKAHDIGLVLFTTAPPLVAQTFVKGQDLQVPIVCDIQGDLVKQLKALWPGRCYLFDSNWRLVWIDRSPGPQYDPFGDATFRAVSGK